MLCHFRALIPGKGAPQLLGQRNHCSGDGIAHGFSAVTSESRPVLDALSRHISVHARQVQQHCEARGALHQRADCRTAQAKNEVAFPVSGDGPVLDLRRSLTDHNGFINEGLAALATPLAGKAKSPAGSQAGGKLTTQGTTCLDIERLVHRFVADAHRQFLGEVKPEPVRALLRAPGTRPAPVLGINGAASFPYHIGATEAGTLGVVDFAG